MTLTFAEVDARFRVLGMALTSRPVDMLGRRWRYGSYYLATVGMSFYSNLAQADQHASEVAWMRQFNGPVVL